MFCENCGKEISEISDGCIYCGVRVKKIPYVSVIENQTEDETSVGLALVSFASPVVGLVLYLVWKRQKPKNAKSCGIGAIVGVVLGFLNLLVLMF